MTTEAGSSRRLEAIVLAAGAGVRFGGAKLTSPWRGGRLIDGALGAAFAAPARSVWVVSGADGGVCPAARAFAADRCESGRLMIVHAADHAEGQAASLRAGIAALPPDTAAAFVFLGDMPDIPHEIARRLAAALTGPAAASAPVIGGVRGHPVLFAAEMFAALRELTGDVGARGVLANLGPRLALVETDDRGVLFDVDAPEDLPP